MKKHLIFLSIISLIMIGVEILVELNTYTPYYATTLPVSFNEPTIPIIKDFYITPITQEEHCVDELDRRVACHQLQGLEDGDILITKSSHTLGFRHGHAGVVVDADEGLVIEAMGYGYPSQIQPITRWNEFPTVKVLRLKDITEELQQEIAAVAMSDYIGIVYDITARPTDPKKTHCSDIVWKIFNHFGYDLDSNGGLLVKPVDILKSDQLEVVSSYGFSPHRPW